MHYSNLHIWRLLRDTSGYISEKKKILTSVLLSRYVCSYIKTNNGLFQYETTTKDWFDIFFFSRIHSVRVCDRMT